MPAMTGLNRALQHIQKNRSILYPLNALKNPPDLYVSFIKVLMSSDMMDSSEASKILHFILHIQRKEGTWPEIMALRPWQEESVVFTSSVGCQLFALIRLFERFGKEVLPRLQVAADFVASREIMDGWFRKSEDVTLDTVNVNALCSLFLIKCYKTFKKQKYLQASLRGVRRVIRSQNENGEFPYYANDIRITTLFYHAFVTNVLTQFYAEYPSSEIIKSAKKGGDWLLKRQSLSGRFSWKGCTDHWTYRNFVTYPITAEVYAYLSRYEVCFREHAQRTLEYVMRLQVADGSFPVKDSRRALQDMSDDIENVKTLFSAKSKPSPPSLLRSARMLIYGTEGNLGGLKYWLMNGFRSYSKDRFVSTLETTDRIINLLKDRDDEHPAFEPSLGFLE